MSVKVDIDIGAIVGEVKKATKPGLRAVAEEVAAAARRTSAFADKDGNLRKSIKVVGGPNAPFLIVEAGEYGYGSRNYSPHAHLIEYGHAIVYVDKGGNRIVKNHIVPGRPFMETARNEVLPRAAEIAARAMNSIDIKVG